MIVIINGPLGVGKSETSWRLLRRFSLAVMLDGDFIAALHPFDYYDQNHLDYAYETFAVLVAHHYRHGTEHIIINWVLESPEQLAKLQQRVHIAGVPIYTYRLYCDPEVISSRIRQRNLPDLAFELRRSRELVDILEVAAQGGEFGVVIDTTRLSVEQTVDALWNDIQKRRG